MRSSILIVRPRSLEFKKLSIFEPNSLKIIIANCMYKNSETMHLKKKTSKEEKVDKKKFVMKKR